MGAINKRKQKHLPVKWIFMGAAAVVLAAVLAVMMLGKSSDGEGIPQVHSAEDAIHVLQSRAEDLGYENALSELTELHCATVSGDSYYRLQQNYRGIPVYGRSVIYAADENGEQLSVIQNIRDIPGGLNLTPTVGLAEAEYYLLKYLAETYPESEWVEHFANENLEALPEFALDPETLYVYDLEGPARLVYEIYLGGLCVLIDAHTGEVAYGYCTTMYEEALFQSTGETIDVGRMKDGTYVLKDESTGTYVYTANGETYSNGGVYDPSRLILLTSENSVFGDLDDSVSRESMETGRKVLERVNDVRWFYDGLQENIIDRLILVYDDKMGLSDGKNAYSNRGTARAFLGSNFFDGGNPFEWVGLIGIGTAYSEDPFQYADIYAHEYTHVVTGILVDWSAHYGETGALNEAYSDIMGELYEAYMKDTEPDWLHGVFLKSDGTIDHISRNLMDPTDKVTYPIDGSWQDYPDHVLNSIWKEIHHQSTIISHIAYKMSVGDPSVEQSAVSLEDLATLWFKSMLLLPSDADYLDCRIAVTLSADHMGLSEAQKKWIGQCFDDAGIRPADDDVDVHFQVQEVFSVDIWDADQTRCTDCEVIVRKAGLAYGPQLPLDAPIRWNSSDSERCHLKLDPGFYTLTVTVHGEPETVKTYDIRVMEDSGGVKEINLFMNQGRAKLDIGVFASGRKETAIPGARIEVYRDNPNGMVYFGELNEKGDGLRLYLEPDKYTIVATAPGYKPGQITIEMRDTSVGYSHSFLLEASEEVVFGQLPPAPDEITGGAPYETLTWVKSGAGETDGVSWTNTYSYDYIVLQGDDPAYEVINRSIYEWVSQEMNSFDDYYFQEPVYDDSGIVADYRAHQPMKVLHNGNGIISVLVNNGTAVTYSLYNGAQLGLFTLAGDYEEAFLQRLNSMYSQSGWQADGLEDFNMNRMAVLDGELIILSSSGIQYTGLYVSTEYTDRLEGTMRAIGGTGSAGYEIQEMYRYFKRLGAPACLQELRIISRYPVLSGTAGCGQINQELYELSEQFVASMPEEDTYTSNKFYFHRYCNDSWGEPVLYETQGIEYNKNGILSYVMDWFIEMSYYKNGQDIDGYERFSGYYGIVYDLETGAHLSLPQITGMDDRTQLLMLKDAYYRAANTSNYVVLVNLRNQQPVIDLSNPGFLLADDGQIYLIYAWEEEPSEAVVAEGWRYRYETAYLIPTDLYVLDP